MPNAIRIDLTASTSSVSLSQSGDSILRDMAALLPSLAANDQTIAFPRLQRPPTINEYLEAPNKGDKAHIQAVFSLHLSACATSKAAKNLNKYRDVLDTPMRDAITRFCNIGAASEIFNIGLVYDVCLPQCFAYWCSWLEGINTFIHGLLGDITPRNFDAAVWDALASMSPRDLDSMRYQSWPDKGLDCDTCPYPDLKHDAGLLPDVNDGQYLAFYNRICQDDNLALDLSTRISLLKFTKCHSPAVKAL